MVLQGQSKYWTYMLSQPRMRPADCHDHENLDVYRIRFFTGNMRNAEDYELLTKLAIQMKFPTEALAAAQKGVSVKLLQGDATRGC